MRDFHVSADQFKELDATPDTLPATGFLWLASGRREFEVNTPELQLA